MKKIISVILSAAMLSSVFCMNVSAAEDSVTKEKLAYLLNAYNINFSIWGKPIIQGCIEDVFVNAQKVYEDSNATDSDYNEALIELKNNALNEIYINYGYAEATYELASKEQNYNNWYSEDDWAEFQNKLSLLKTELDKGNGLSLELSYAHRSLMGIYNKMTNSHTLRGDVNGDGTVNVEDATLIQKYLVGLENLTGAQKMLANAENYENPTVTEATMIQKYSVGIIDELPNYGHFLVDEGLDFIDENIVYERTLNFNICPRKYNSMLIENEYKYQLYCIIIGYYSWCNENGYTP